MDLITKIENFYPFVALLAGLGGSLHCVGMCGGLVTASCQNKTDVTRYQIGRLLGYALVGAIGGFIGSFLNIQNISPAVSLISGLTIGALFIFWGLKSFRGKKAELPLPKFLAKFYFYLYQRLVIKNKKFSKSFFTGLISILLPCGLLYGVIIGAIAIKNPLIGMLSMLFFWLGTLPAMVLVPTIFQKIIGPLQSKIPKTYAIGLMMIGLVTISVRVNHFYHMNAHHPKDISQDSASPLVPSCH